MARAATNAFAEPGLSMHGCAWYPGADSPVKTRLFVAARTQADAH